jgi:hypothetical protein
MMRACLCCALGLCLANLPANGQRARDLGVPFEGTPGPLNAITDIAVPNLKKSPLAQRRSSGGTDQKPDMPEWPGTRCENSDANHLSALQND